MSEKRLEFSLVEQKNINSIPIIIENSTGVDQSVKDLSLGSISFIQPCYTCGLTDDCHGHVGRYIIKNPLFKVCFKKSIEFILKTICPVCGMIKHQTIINLLEKIYKNNNIITTKDRKVFKEILINSKSYNKQTKTKCANDFCRIQTTSIQYTKNNNFIYSTETKNILSMENIYNYLLNLPYNFKRLLTPNNSFKTISPENVFYNENFLIPSNFIRQPNIYEDIVFDPFTSDLNSLIKTLNNGFMGYKKAQNLLDSIDNNQGFNPYNTNTKKLNLSILTNGTSKDSYLRKEINGKRVIGTARAVISPGIKIPIGYIEIPIYILNNLRDVVFYNYITKKYILEKLNSNNKDKQFIDYIKVNHNDITPYKVISLLDNHKLIAPVYGDMFETIKHPGQYICYSRQPSIHCWNFQSAEILEKKSNIDDKTINIPPSIGPSQNADYDGDEMLNKTFYNPSANIEQGLIVNSKNLLKHHCTGTVMFGFVQDQIVAANLLLHEEEISLDKSFLIYGEYSFMLEKKPTFTGRELISLIFPKHYTFNNVFKDGFLIVPNILTNMVSANSYNSIFNGLSQYYGNDYTITIIDVFKTILQNYLMYYGLSIKITDIVPRYELINEIELEVRKHVININNKLNLLKKDVNDNKIIITNHEEISDLKLKNIEEMTNKIKKYMINVIEKEYQKKDNVFTICYNMGYKLTLNDVLSLLCFTGQKKNKKMPIPTINGKTYLYDLPNDIDVETSGFITSPVIKGLSYNEYVIMIKEESLPQIVNVTSGTSQTGYMGKKIIKMTSEIFINNDRFMVSNKHIINFNPNFLKISVADTSKVLFVMPNDYFVWKKEINDLFNTNLKDYVIQKKKTKTHIRL